MKSKNRRILLWAAVLCFTMAVLVAGCAPGANSTEKSTSDNASATEGEQSETSTDFGFADFTERSTGLFPDVQENAKYQNSGNRGCAACHSDLMELDKDNGTYTHITTYVGLKTATYNGDCVCCHSLTMGTTGNLMSENIHVSHYSNDLFVDANGNCWSCHVMQKNDDGTQEMVLFEDIMYDASYGGYPGTLNEPDTQRWNVMRGFSTGFLSGVSTDDGASLSISMDQVASAEEDEFLVQNYLRIDGNDVYSQLDPATWTMEVSGVSQAGSISLNDLKAMPQTEITAMQSCFVNGINGAMVDNMPMKGVLIKDFIEALGGLDAGANNVNFTAADGWIIMSSSTEVQELIDEGAMIVFENYGHDLTIPQGGPAKLFIPGTGGNVDIKYLTAIEFTKVDKPTKTSDLMLPLAGVVYPINTVWFDNDGVEGKAGQELSLEGAAYGWTIGSFDYDVKRIEFSLDYGATWQSYDVPADFDELQWVHYTLNWTPQEAGTYILKAKAIGANGEEQTTESSIIVTVSE